MASPDGWAEQFEPVVETDEESFAEEVNCVEVAAEGGNVEIGVRFNSSVLEVDFLFASCKRRKLTKDNEKKHLLSLDGSSGG